MTDKQKEYIKELEGRIAGLLSYVDTTETSLVDWTNEDFLKEKTFKEILNCLVISGIEATKIRESLEQIQLNVKRLKQELEA